jgi:hypothetical protein
MRTKLLSGTGFLVLPLIVLMMGLAVSGRPIETAMKPANAYSDPIKIDTRYISGTVIGDVGKEVHIYRGIPYADMDRRKVIVFSFCHNFIFGSF